VKKKQLPLIPCQGIAFFDVIFDSFLEIYLKDLLYHDEVLPNFANGLVDFRKLDTMGEIINYFRKCQMTKYQLQQDPGMNNGLSRIPSELTI
jgi:hypothetical protein